MTNANNNPCLDATLGNALQQAATARIEGYTFTEVMNCDFGNITNFNDSAEVQPDDRAGQPNSGHLPRSIGQFDIDGEGTLRDVFKVEPLTDGVYASQHRRTNPDETGLPEDGRRDHAWHNKAYTDTLNEQADHITQEGAVIPNTSAEYLDYGTGHTFNLATSWLDTFATTRLDANNEGPNVPNPATPNVTFGPDTFFELEVNFSSMQTPGFRHSWWLMPATINDRPGESVVFGDNAARDADNNLRVLDGTAYDGTGAAARNGVEIDIYEHEVGNGGNPDNTLLMKVIAGNGGAEQTTDNTFDTRSVTAAPIDNSTDVIVPGINAGWHRIGFLWRETELVWFVDGQAVVRDTDNMPNDVRMYMILSRELNDILFGGDPTTAANRALIPNDSVGIRNLRVWSVDDNGGADLTVVQTGPTVSGTVSAQFFNRGVFLPIGNGYTANADGAGNWSITIPPAEPSQANVNAFVSDGNGNSTTAMFDYTA